MLSFFSNPNTPFDYRAPRVVYVRGGRIESVESADRSRLVIEGRELDLPDGAIILPGFVDTHCHLIGLGLMASRVPLRGAWSARECAERALQHARALPADGSAGAWVVGFGWNQEEWGNRALPDRADLDALLPDRPAVMYRIDSHAAWCNGRALEMAGIIGNPLPEMEGGSIHVDEEGRPTGILVDNAMRLIEAVIPPPSVEEQAAWIERGIAECLRFGITEIHDMNVEPERIPAMIRVAERGAMPLRCQVFLKGAEEAWRAYPVPGALAPNLNLVGVKYFADGALGSRGALLLEPYSDAPETRGLALMAADELARAATAPLEHGYAVAAHAIGDAANRLVLDAYEDLRRRFPDALLRIEHAQTVHPADLPRFAALRVIPAMQAVHCTSDARMAESRLGGERCSHTYPWASMLRTGVPVLGGSDFPIESADPLAGLRAFAGREPEPGAGPWYGAERITPGEALDAYTAWAPLGIPEAPNRGRLTAGCNADLVVLTGDPFTDPDARALVTVVAGEVVWRESGSIKT